MTNSVVQMEHTKMNWTPEQLKLIKDTVAKGATDNELSLFLYRCKAMDLDPLKPGQIYFIKYGQGPGTIVVGIDGFRARAARTGQLSGIERGVIRDSSGHCIGAWAKVHRKDWTHPASEEVDIREYDTGRGQWAKMPSTMIKKVAEAAALRMAFPDELGGVYEKAEMEQAESKGHVYPEQPRAQDGNHNHETGYKIPFGKFAKRSIEEIEPKELGRYVLWMEDKAVKDAQPLSDQQAEFVHRASTYLSDLENLSLFEEKTERPQA